MNGTGSYFDQKYVHRSSIIYYEMQWMRRASDISSICIRRVKNTIQFPLCNELFHLVGNRPDIQGVYSS